MPPGTGDLTCTTQGVVSRGTGLQHWAAGEASGTWHPSGENVKRWVRAAESGIMACRQALLLQEGSMWRARMQVGARCGVHRLSTWQLGTSKCWQMSAQNCRAQLDMCPNDSKGNQLHAGQEQRSYLDELPQDSLCSWQKLVLQVRCN